MKGVKTRNGFRSEWVIINGKSKHLKDSLTLKERMDGWVKVKDGHVVE